MSRRGWLIAAGVAMVALWIAMGVVERSLTEGSPGTIEFEFVGSQDRAEEMLSEWDGDDREAVRLGLWLDYGFMLAYGAFFTLAGLATRDFARERGRERLASVGRWAPWCAAGAALFDALENANLLLILGRHALHVAPPLATAFASVKFLLIVTAIGYVVWGLAARLRAR